jgi:4-hydroxyphenylacetate 3-monooxygenase
LAVRVAVVEALIRAQEVDPMEWPGGYVSQNRQTLYATMAWTCEQYPSFVENVRDLLGSTPFQVPASASVFDDEDVKTVYSQFLRVTPDEALDRYKLVKVLWDLVGSEFASRHLQYETLYAGPKHVTRGRAGHFFNWDIVTERAARSVEDIDDN